MKKYESKLTFLKLISLSFLRVSSERKIHLYLSVLLVISLFILKNIFNEFVAKFKLLDLTVIILFYFSIVAVGLDFIKIIILSSYRKRNKLEVGKKDNITVGIERIYWLVVVLGWFFMLLYLNNIDMLSFFTTFALVSVAFSWIFKEYINNLIDGLLILFSSDFKIGDYVKISEFKGKIKDITFINSTLITDEGDLVFIPNSLILQKEVINFSKVKNKRIIYDFEIDKSLFPKIRKVEKSILKHLRHEFEEIIDSDSFYLKVNSVTHQGAELSAEISVKKYNFSIENEIEKNISLSVMEFIDKEEDN